MSGGERTDFREGDGLGVSGWPVVSDVISRAYVRKPEKKPKSRRFRSIQDGEPELISMSPYFGDFYVGLIL